MRLPVFTVSTKSLGSCATQDAGRSGIEPQGCSTAKKIACAGALAACAAVCVGTGGTACAACFAGLGMGSCIDCL